MVIPIWGAQKGIVSSSCTDSFLGPALAKGSGETVLPIVAADRSFVKVARPRFGRRGTGILGQSMAKEDTCAT